MGRTNAGIGIKTETEIHPLKSIVKTLFGENYQQTTEYGDIRNNDWLVISKSKEFIYIQKSDYAEEFFNNQVEFNIQKLNEHFSNPELIIAYEQYDSGGTYSYALVKKGLLKRRFRSLSYETVIDEGELESIEIEWKNAEIKEFDLGDGEKEIILKNKVTGEECDKGSEPEVILNHILYHQLKIENDDYPIIEYAFYKKVEEIELDEKIEMSEENKAILKDFKERKPKTGKKDVKKPWWKKW